MMKNHSNDTYTFDIIIIISTLFVSIKELQSYLLTKLLVNSYLDRMGLQFTFGIEE